MIMSCQRLTIPLLSIYTALFLAFTTTSYAGVLEEQLQASVDNAAPYTELPVIITFSDKVSPASFSKSPRKNRSEIIKAMRRKADDSQKSLKSFLQAQGIKKIKSLWIINGMAIRATPGLIRQLADWPGVEEIRSNGTISPPVVTPQAAGDPEWNITAVNAPQLWSQGMTGAGMVIASLDSGVDPDHIDLQTRWRGGNSAACDPLTNSNPGDWFDPHDEHPNCPYDSVGHGTAVMGLMVGGDSGGTAIGVAPDATWISAKIFNDAGDPATFSIIHSAFQWVLDPDGDINTDDAPDIVNNSWGFETAVNQCLTEFQPDIQLLKATGIAVVFSGGNTGPDPSSSVSPANYPESFAAGAIDQNNLIGSFSARGPTPCPTLDQIFPQIAAPGVSVKTADLTLGGAIPGSYATVSGTSFAAAHVSGVMALLLGTNAFPTTSVSDLENALKITATDLGPTGPDHDFGYGLVNAATAADELTNKPPLPATLLSPTDGASGLGTNVTFLWTHSTDPDGDQTTDIVSITEIGPAPALLALSSSSLDNFPTWLAAFLLLGSFFFILRRKRYLAGVCGLLAVSAMLSCGGGGGSASSSFTATGLKSGTIYSWKVVSTDSAGETAETAAWTFTTR